LNPRPGLYWSASVSRSSLRFAAFQTDLSRVHRDRRSQSHCRSSNGEDCELSIKRSFSMISCSKRARELGAHVHEENKRHEQLVHEGRYWKM
jgi:hypothetical protein